MPYTPYRQQPLLERDAWRELARLQRENQVLRDLLKYYGEACHYVAAEMLKLSDAPAQQGGLDP